MKLSGFGKLQMNNPGRAWAQRHVTAKHMRRLGGDVAGGTALEIGCGRGVGIEILLDDFKATRVDAFDLDESLVERARERLEQRANSARLWVGTATRIAVPDATYDAVFDFGVTHQIEDWRLAVAECARVLKPDGRLYFEQVTSRWYRAPMNLAMERGSPDVRKIGFDREAYIEALESAEISVGTNYVTPRSPFTAIFTGDLIGAGIHKGQ